MMCAYCGQALQVVAGFCTHCQAPVEIASRARFVARTLQHTQEPTVANAVTLPPLSLPAPPLPRLPTRLLVCGGIVALALVVVTVSLRLGVNPIHALVAPLQGELMASLTPGGASVPRVAAGSTFTLRYAVTVEATSAQVTLRVAPEGLPARSMTERWPRGTSQRSQNLVAVAPGVWHISVARDGVLVRQIDLTISGDPMSLTNRSSNALARFGRQVPAIPGECGLRYG